jgi:hypothetical protein
VATSFRTAKEIQLPPPPTFATRIQRTDIEGNRSFSFASRTFPSGSVAFFRVARILDRNLEFAVDCVRLAKVRPRDEPRDEP